MAEIALKIVQLIESANTLQSVVQQPGCTTDFMTAPYCKSVRSVAQQVVQQPHTRCDCRYNR
jgi:hypothetical protein